MTADDLDAYLRDVGLDVEVLTGDDHLDYTVVAGLRIPSGGLAGRSCDVAIQRVSTVPYLVPAAIHTRPALLPMQGGEPYGTAVSQIGSDWQYWSRRFDRVPTPEAVWAHVLTILCDDRWPSS